MSKKSIDFFDGQKVTIFWPLFGQKLRLSMTFAKKWLFFEAEVISKKTKKRRETGFFGKKHVKNV